MSDVLLEVKDLKTYFPVREGLIFERQKGAVKAVDGVSLQVHRGEILGLVGESGCGKSTLARAVMQLVPATGGTVLLEGRNVAEFSKAERRAMCLKMQMIFQDPYASLNPRMTVFDAIAEPMLVHRLVKRKDLAKEVADIMSRVGLDARFMRKYPHEFSGGQRQRIAIARTLALKPKLIFADEPVSALDVSVQAQILNLIADLCRESDLSMVFISHDLSVVRHLADRIAVMYLGKIVEEGPAEAVIDTPIHPYTQALVQAIPIPDPERKITQARVIGEPPSPLNPPPGCTFHPRCPLAVEHCKTAPPPLEEKKPNHRAACYEV